MPRIAYFQPFSGISGDMTLGALVDAGLAFEELAQGLRALALGGYRLERERTWRGAFATTRVRVVLDDAASNAPAGSPRDRQSGENSESHEHSHEHGHGHSHSHSHEHSHSHTGAHTHAHAHTHSHAHAHGPTRGLREILALLDSSSLPDPVRANAARVFRRLGEAEAKAHGIPIDDVHFHEVGAVDSIVDITGSCLGLHLLGVDEVWSAPVALGQGWIEIAHGRVALPAPATIELLRGVPVEQRESGFELTTPTGAAILSTLARGFGPMPAARVVAVGYGAGNDRPGPVPNCLRVILAEVESESGSSASRNSTRRDTVVVLETNIDDMSPEWLGYLSERLFESGALDVTIAPVLMKKGRAAHAVSVIAPPALEDRLAGILFSEGTTFGIRRREMERLILDRELREVDTPWGRVRIKLGRKGDTIVSASPEYEDLRAAAAKAGLPLRDIHRRALELFWESGRDAAG